MSAESEKQTENDNKNDFKSNNQKDYENYKDDNNQKNDNVNDADDKKDDNKNEDYNNAKGTEENFESESKTNGHDFHQIMKQEIEYLNKFLACIISTESENEETFNITNTVIEDNKKSIEKLNDYICNLDEILCNYNNERDEQKMINEDSHKIGSIKELEKYLQDAMKICITRENSTNNNSRINDEEVKNIIHNISSKRHEETSPSLNCDNKYVFGAYDKFALHSESKKFQCTENHHKCICEYLAHITVSFYEVLKEKELLKQKELHIHDLKDKLKNQINLIRNNMDRLSDNFQLSLNTISNHQDRFHEAYQLQADKMRLLSKTAGWVFTDKIRDQDQIIRFMKERQEIETKEKNKLVDLLKIFDQNKMKEIDKIEKKRDQLQQDCQELSHSKQDIEKQFEIIKIQKDAEISKKNVEFESEKKILIHQHANELNKVEVDLEHKLDLVEIQLRNVIRTLFTKLCQKCGIISNARKEYLSTLEDEKDSKKLAMLIEDIIADEIFK